MGNTEIDILPQSRNQKVEGGLRLAKMERVSFAKLREMFMTKLIMPPKQGQID